MPITLADVDGFSKCFHCWIHQEICNKVIFTLPFAQHTLNLLLHYLVKWRLSQTKTFYIKTIHSNFSSDKQNVSLWKFKCKLQRLFEMSPFARTQAQSRERHWSIVSSVTLYLTSHKWRQFMNRKWFICGCDILQELINSNKWKLYCVWYITLEVFEKWKLVQRDVWVNNILLQTAPHVSQMFFRHCSFVRYSDCYYVHQFKSAQSDQCLAGAQINCCCWWALGYMKRKPVFKLSANNILQHSLQRRTAMTATGYILKAQSVILQVNRQNI